MLSFYTPIFLHLLSPLAQIRNLQRAHMDAMKHFPSDIPLHCSDKPQSIVPIALVLFRIGIISTVLFRTIAEHSEQKNQNIRILTLPFPAQTAELCILVSAAMHALKI